MAVPQNEILTDVTKNYLAALDMDNIPGPQMIERELMDKVNVEFTVENTGRVPGNKIALLKTLTNSQIAQVALRVHGVVGLLQVKPSDIDADGAMRTAYGEPKDTDMLAVYNPARGIYESSQTSLRRLVRQYDREMETKQYREIMAIMSESAPRKRPQIGSHWIPLANGDLNFKTKALHPFSPDRVFTSRIPHTYNSQAQNPVFIHPDDKSSWDVESWILELACGNRALCELFWQVLGASVRSQNRWNKAVGLYDVNGNNGKGTFLDLTRNLAGQDNSLSASIAELGKESTHAVIPGHSIITSDENDTNAFVKSASALKKLVTGDPILVNPKYLSPYNYSFIGFQVHCFNEFPKFGDKSQSQWRRWLLIPCAAQFEGRERKYIKNDYISRPEVLEYVLKRVLDMNFDGLSETDETRALLAEAKIHNDPVRMFWEEHKDEFTWDMLPLDFLYAVFKAWFDDKKPSGMKGDYAPFCDTIRAAVAESDDGWQDHGKGKKMKAASRMAAHEPLVQDYDLHRKWHADFDRNKLFSNVLHRDPAAVSPTPLAEVERQHAADIAHWERLAVSSDQVSDTAHVHDHAMIRRSGDSCECTSGKQVTYPEYMLENSRLLDMALAEAQEVTA